MACYVRLKAGGAVCLCAVELVCRFWLLGATLQALDLVCRMSVAAAVIVHCCCCCCCCVVCVGSSVCVAVDSAVYLCALDLGCHVVSSDSAACYRLSLSSVGGSQLVLLLLLVRAVGLVCRMSRVWWCVGAGCCALLCCVAVLHNRQWLLNWLNAGNYCNN